MKTQSPAPPLKPLRSDARVRREALLWAAQEAIVELGVDVPLEEIARRAKVGRGTFYRNFPDRLALCEALLDLEVDRLEAASRKMAKRTDGFFLLFSEAAHGMSLTALLAHEINRDAHQKGEVSARAHRFLSLFEPLIRQAQSAGLLREDFQVEDVLHLSNMLIGGVQGLPAQARERQLMRAVELMFEGLKKR